MKKLFALAMLSVGFATSAHADLISANWTDSANLGPNGQYIGSGDSYTYTHNITDNGFRPSIDVLQNFRLSINLADDRDSIWDLFEVASVDLPGVLGDSGWISNFNLGGEEYGGWSIQGLAQLNNTGLLSVTVNSVLGDFFLAGSTLTANGLRETGSATNVPEPGALGLLGVGLLGMAVSMRRRKQTSR